MPNIRFNYHYRDSANYKKFGYVVFGNPEHVDLAELDVLIRSKLVDEMFFYTTPWQLPNFISGYLRPIH